MKSLPAKLLLFIVTSVLLVSCNAVKRVENNELLLTDNTISINGEKSNENRLYNQLYQDPNSRLLGVPLRLHFYNLARPNPDSVFVDWLHRKPNREQRLVNIYSRKQVEKMRESYVNFHEWIKRTGEAPVIIDEELTRKSRNRLQSWYFNNGWFNAEIDYEIKPSEKEKRGEVEYYVTSREPYMVDSIRQRIASPVIDSIYDVHAGESTIESGKQYRTLDFNEERDRLTSLFRNNGIYFFDQEYISFEADTVDTNQKVNATVIIPNRQITEGDNTRREPFKIHKISKVNVFTDYSFSNRNSPVTDSVHYNGYYIYSFGELEYKPKAISDAIFIRPGEIFRDRDRTRTYNRMSSLRVFKYPNIDYSLDPADTTNTALIANIFLSPQQKYSLGFDFDISQSNIQDFGIGFGGSLLIRNVFRGAENFEISGRGSIGSSSDVSRGSRDRFFNISEVGADVKLTFPRIFLPFDTENFIPKYMSPFTSLSVGISTQNNIGLDKQNVNGILNYRWNPSPILSHSLDLVNIQYVRNLNTENYFNVYRNSYGTLNEILRSGNVVTDPAYLDEQGRLTIPTGAEEFITDVTEETGNTTGLTPTQRQEVRNIAERKNRLTEDNLIFSSNFTFIRNNKENLYDNDFSRFRFKVETAGNVLAVFSELTGVEKNSSGNFDIWGVNFSQYGKVEIDYIKHWDWGNKNIFAIRTFGGVAIPYGNANSIPFIRSFFAGGPNDNRAWQAYDLGPGSSGGRNEFNEANMKIALNGEYRFNLIGALNSALFVDIGNIWNVLDVVEEEAATFTSFSDLKDIAIGTGTGLRYDFNFFVLRFDVGFKTYNPARPEGERWFKEYNFNNAVYNVGINYPF